MCGSLCRAPCSTRAKPRSVASCAHAQVILYRRCAAAMAPLKYSAYPLLLHTLQHIRYCPWVVTLRARTLGLAREHS